MNPFRQWILNQILNAGNRSPNEEELLKSLKAELKEWFVHQMNQAGIPASKQDELLQVLEKEFRQLTDLDKALDTLTGDILDTLRKHIEGLAKTVQAHQRMHSRRTQRKGKANGEDHKTNPDGSTKHPDARGQDDLDRDQS
jgi:hypothetical protein